METPTIWTQEIEPALITYTKDVIQFLRNGKPYDLPVSIRKPDEELKIEKYPCITWYGIMDLNNVYRTDNVAHTYKNPETGVETEYYLPVPYDMYYQIDFWAKHYEDINLMTRLWQESLPPYSRGTWFNLPVTDSLGNKTSVLCRQKDINRRRDTLTDGEKTLHSTMMYAIQGQVGRLYRENTDGLIETINVEKRGVQNNG